jgi:3',5'-cyclic AMP phosphodiesterase CpdA
MRFIQISDIHYLEHYPKNASGYKAFLPCMTNPLEFVKTIGLIAKKEVVDAILITGDLIDDGTSRDYILLKEIFKNVFEDIPVLIGPGNHDQYEAFNQVFFDEQSPAKHINKIYEFDELRIIFFDNTFEKSATGKVTSSQVDWLEEVLQESNKPVLLMTHHHLLHDQSEIPALPENQRFKALIENSLVTGILCGHTHHGYTSVFANKFYTTSPSLSFQVRSTDEGKLVFEENPGYQIIEYQQETLSVQTKYLLSKPIPLFF